ncbi:hypothetical protein PIECOFPK_02854 [Mycovorax composti]|uniref:FAS1 domain-containing protein n=1 Tax=Mycovorax composti TaxID=2962693 RepID=A0ABZ2EPD3_9BACT
MKKILFIGLLAVLMMACKKDYIIGGTRNETNKVNMTTYEFLKSQEITQSVARLFERANLINEINGDVTLISPNQYSVNRYLRRINNRRLRLDPRATLWTVEDIPVEDLQQLKMYVVRGKYTSNELNSEGIKLATLNGTDSVLLALRESTAEPAAAWDGSNVSGAGYQYPNFMQTIPKKVFVHFKRGANWETTGEQRAALGYDNPECDQVYQMYLSDVETTTGVVHILYVGNYNFNEHYYYHTLFFLGTRADDLL